jgi:LysR family transcriptional regulator, transcriptional activator of the cysJI operon
MQIESLKVFCDLAETESFTKAAQINQVTQSAVSQTITSLERLFSSLLIERSKKNFRLTPEGEVLYDYSKRILQTYDSLHSKLQDLEDIVLPPYLKKFIKNFPTVNVHVEYRRANQVYEDVLGNVVDLGLIAYPVRDSKLEVVPLAKDPLVVIFQPQHPFAKLDQIKFKALDGQKFVHFDRDIPTRKALDRLFKDHNIDVETVMEFDNVETVKRAVEIGSGISIVPEATVRQEVQNHTLSASPLEGGDHSRPVAALYKKNKVLSPAIRQLLAVLKGPP